MDKLDEIILSVLSDDGLCHRGKQKQAERRRKLRAAFDQYMAIELADNIRKNQQVPSFQSGVFVSNPQMSGYDDPNRPEHILTDEQLQRMGLINDELQFNEQDK